MNTIRRTACTASGRSIRCVKCSLEKTRVCSADSITETDSVLILGECFYNEFNWIQLQVYTKKFGSLTSGLYRYSTFWSHFLKRSSVQVSTLVILQEVARRTQCKCRGIKQKTTKKNQCPNLQNICIEFVILTSQRPIDIWNKFISRTPRPAELHRKHFVNRCTPPKHTPSLLLSTRFWISNSSYTHTHTHTHTYSQKPRPDVFLSLN
jgi:hypothetical protein